MSSRTFGYVVLECADEFEQVLALDQAPAFPKHGILTWATDKLKRAVFETRPLARAAIERTEHYRLAFDRTDLPARAYCRIEPVRFVGIEDTP